MSLKHAAFIKNFTRFNTLVVGLFALATDLNAQTSSIKTQEIIVQRGLIGAPSFLGFDIGNNVLEYRDSHRGNKSVGLRSVNIKSGKDNWFVDKVDLPIRINPAGNLVVTPNIVNKRKQSIETGFRVLRVTDGSELYSTAREPVASFAFSLLKNQFVTYAFKGHSFQFLEFGKSEGELVRGELLKPTSMTLFSDAQTYNGAFSPNLKYFAAQIVHFPIVAPQKYYLRQWDFRNEKVLWTTEVPNLSAYLHLLSYSSNGKWIVGSLSDNTTRIWDVETGKELEKIAHVKDTKDTPFCCHAISPDSKWLATGSGPGKSCEVNIWEMPTAKKLLTLNVNEGEIVSVAFNRKGDLLAAGSERALHVWSLRVPK